MDRPLPPFLIFESSIIDCCEVVSAHLWLGQRREELPAGQLPGGSRVTSAADLARKG